MVKLKRFKLLIFSVFFLTPLFLNAQNSVNWESTEKAFNEAYELYNDSHYGAAKIAFEKLLEKKEHLPSRYTSDATYYISMCALKLRNNDASYKMGEFLEEFPEHTKSRKMFFQLANQKFENRKYREALKFYDKVDFENISDKDIVQYYFRTGYAFMKTKQREKAIPAFREIIDIPSDYQEDALYYYSHLMFEDNKHDEALEGFMRIKDSRKYKKIVPYYIIQSYFVKEQYQKVIDEAIPYLKIARSKHQTGLSGIIGESYYRLNDLANALPYLETYHSRTRNVISRENHYQLAYIYFHNEFYQKAMPLFEKAADANDALAQNAHYHLGMCYVKTDQKRFAINSFKKAYQYDFDENIKEDALYNYAKLAYENIDNPYSNAVEAMQQYIDSYPDTPRADEMYSYLMSIFLSTNDYKRALSSFDEIKIRNTKLNKAYQKIAFNRGIELFNDGRLNEAIQTFKLSLQQRFDQNLTALANFWIAESFYRQRKYAAAISFYNKFQGEQSAYGLKQHPQAYYGKGYSYFMQKKYNQAIVPFRNYIIGTKNRDQRLMNDIYNRLGDCYFISKEYDKAIEFYDKAIRNGSVDADYAHYQQALANGGKGLYSRKVQILNELVRTFPKSTYADDARYEAGVTYLIMNNNEAAIKSFQNLTKYNPKSSYLPLALLKTGLIYYDLMQNQLALSTLKKVVDKYSGSNEAKQALTTIRNIYVEMNKVDDYLAYSRGINSGMVNVSEEDSLMYIAAENQYMNSDWEASRKSFAEYLTKFPNGGFTMNAHFYKADCDFRAKDYDQALQGYEFVLSKPNNKFTESALFKTSGIYLIRQNWTKALDLFVRLEQVAEYKDNLKNAYSGQMKCNYQLKNFREAIVAATKLLESKKLDMKHEVEARLIKAKSAMSIGDFNLAKTEFFVVRQLSQAVEGAEANYSLAWIAFNNNNLETSEQIILETAEKYSAYDYWVAKSFILLSDIYKAKKNIFQAKQTLMSIIDNYPGDDLKKTAKRKLEILEEQEASEKAAKGRTPESESDY